MTNNPAPTRRRALLSMIAMTVLPIPSLTSTGTIARLDGAPVNGLWRPLGPLRSGATHGNRSTT